MIENKFYKHVSSWISSYRDAAAIQSLLPFIYGSKEPVEIKERLLREASRKAAFLQRRPCFESQYGTTYLVDADGSPCLYTSRFAAICKVTELKLRGYDAALQEGSAFYKIVLQDTAPVNLESLAA